MEKIIEATIEDAQAILTLQKEAYISEAMLHDDYTIPPLVQTLEELIQDFDNHLFLKVTKDAKIIGSVKAKVIDQTCYIGRLIVDTNYQNQGIATRLMDTIEKRFQNCNRFEIYTGQKSAKNIYLYQKWGYQIYKERKLNEKSTVVHMEKRKKEV